MEVAVLAPSSTVTFLWLRAARLQIAGGFIRIPVHKNYGLCFGCLYCYCRHVASFFEGNSSRYTSGAMIFHCRETR